MQGWGVGRVRNGPRKKDLEALPLIILLRSPSMYSISQTQTPIWESVETRCEYWDGRENNDLRPLLSVEGEDMLELPWKGDELSWKYVEKIRLGVKVY